MHTGALPGSAELIPATVIEKFCRTVEHEYRLEIDFDHRAIIELRNGNEKLLACIKGRLDRCLTETAASKGDSPQQIQSVQHVPNQNLSEEEPHDIARIVQDLIEARSDARTGCQLSRRFRYEVVALYIMDSLAARKDRLVAGVFALRAIIDTCKGATTDNQLRQYVGNIEMRLADIENLYEEVFCTSFDSENPSSEEHNLVDYVTKSLDNLSTDLAGVKDQLHDLAFDESDRIGRMRHFATELSINQTELAQAAATAAITRGELDSAFNRLQSAMRRLDGALNRHPRASSDRAKMQETRD